jgi:hypothetical protein
MSLTRFITGFHSCPPSWSPPNPNHALPFASNLLLCPPQSYITNCTVCTTYSTHTHAHIHTPLSPIAHHAFTILNQQRHPSTHPVHAIRRTYIHRKCIPISFLSNALLNLQSAKRRRAPQQEGWCILHEIRSSQTSSTEICLLASKREDKCISQVNHTTSSTRHAQVWRHGRYLYIHVWMNQINDMSQPR